MMEKCGICKEVMDDPNDKTTENCGGDCLYCMYQAGDPDCTMALVEIYENKIGELTKRVSELETIQ